jgi:hypothetical protein
MTTVNFGVDTLGIMVPTDKCRFLDRCPFKVGGSYIAGSKDSPRPDLYTTKDSLKTHDGDYASFKTPNCKVSIGQDKGGLKTGNRSNLYATLDAGAFAPNNLEPLSASGLIRVLRLIEKELETYGCFVPDLTCAKIFRLDLTLNHKLQQPFAHYMPAMRAEGIRPRRSKDDYGDTGFWFDSGNKTKSWEIAMYDKFVQLTKQAKMGKVPPPPEHLKNLLRCEIRALTVRNVKRFFGVSNVQELQAIAPDWLTIHQQLINKEVFRHKPNLNLPASSTDLLFDLEALVASSWEGEKRNSYPNFERMAGRHYLLNAHGLPQMKTFVEQHFCDHSNPSSIRTLRTYLKELENTNLSLTLSTPTPSGASLSELYKEIRLALIGS